MNSFMFGFDMGELYLCRILILKAYPMEMRNLIVATTFIFSAASCARKITETGKASFYADKFQGRATASGETFNSTLDR